MSWLNFESKEDINKQVEENSISIKIIKGRNMPQGNLFCTIKNGKQCFKTEVVNCSNPEWNQIFSFASFSAKDNIEIHCYIEGFLSNTLIGSIKIPIIEHNYISFIKALPCWFNLNNSEICCIIGIEKADNIISQSYADSEDNRNTEEIYSEAIHHLDIGNVSAKKSLQTCDNIKSINDEILLNLKKDEMSVKKMHDDVDKIKSNAKQSSRKLRSIESVWGTVLNKFTPSVKNKKRKKDIHKIKDKGNKESKDTINRVKTFEISKDLNTDSKNDFEIKYNENEIVIAKISESLDDIKSTSLEIGKALLISNEKLANLKSNVDKTVPEMENITKRARIVIKK